MLQEFFAGRYRYCTSKSIGRWQCVERRAAKTGDQGFAETGAEEFTD